MVFFWWCYLPVPLSSLSCYECEGAVGARLSCGRGWAAERTFSPAYSWVTDPLPTFLCIFCMLSDCYDLSLTATVTMIRFMHFLCLSFLFVLFWCFSCSRLLAAEKMDRTSIQRRFFEQHRGQPGGATAPPSSLGAIGASVGARGRGVTRATSGAAEGHSSRRDVLASLDLLALSSDGSKRGRPALRSGARRPPGGPTAEHSATLPDYHRSKRRRPEARVGTLPSDREPVVARPPGWDSEERSIGKRPMDAVAPTMSDRVVRRRTEASDPSVPVPDTSPSFETHGGQSLHNRFQPQQLSSGGDMSSPDGTRPFNSPAELGRPYLQGHTPSSSTAVLDYRRRAPLSSQPSEADNWGLLVQASLAAHLPQPPASSPRPSAAAAGAHGAPLSFCFSSRPGRGSALNSTSLAAGFDVPASRDAGIGGGSRDNTPLAAARRERDGSLSASGERGQLGVPDAVHTASGSDSLRVAPRSMRLRYPELGVAGRPESLPVAPITRLPSSSRRLHAGQGHLSDQPRTLSANPMHASHANQGRCRLADDGPLAAGLCPRTSPCLSERGRGASGAGDRPRDQDSWGRDLSLVARTLSSNPSTGSSGYGLYAVKQSGLRAGPIAPSALSAELGALERKILGNADEDTGSAFQFAPKMSSSAADARRPSQSRAGGASCSGGAEPEDGSSARASSSSRRGASTSSRSVSNPLASTSCPLDASLAEAL